MKLSLYSIFIISIVKVYGDNILYELSKHPESYQSSGSIQDNYFTQHPQIKYNKIYKRHINFTLETSTNKQLNFGQAFTFPPLDDFCNSEFEKDNAKVCLKYHPNNWNCIYNNCISLPRTIPDYTSLVLPPININNETTKQCDHISIGTHYRYTCSRNWKIINLPNS